MRNKKFQEKYRVVTISEKISEGKLYSTVTTIYGYEKQSKLRMYKEIEELKRILKRNLKDLGYATFNDTMYQLNVRLRKLRGMVKYTDTKYTLFRDSVKWEVVSKTNLSQYQRLSQLDSVRNVLREKRVAKRVKKHTSKRFRGTNYITWGGAFLEKESILTIAIRKKARTMLDSKAPKNNENHIGVELEFCSKMNQSDMLVELYKIGVVEYCQLMEDGSLRPNRGEYGHEIAIVAPESKINGIVTKIVDKLKELGAEVKDRRCGLHIHLDMRNRDHDKCYQNLTSCQRFMFDMMPEHRRDGEFCRRIGRKRKFPEQVRGSRNYDVRRYASINAQSYYKHKTLEVRMHEGSIDSKDIVSWIKFLTRIIDCPTKLSKAFTSVIKMSKGLELNSELMGYVKRRIKENKITVVDRRVPRARTSLGERAVDPTIVQPPDPVDIMERVYRHYDGLRTMVAADLAPSGPQITWNDSILEVQGDENV